MGRFFVCLNRCFLPGSLVSVGALPSLEAVTADAGPAAWEAATPNARGIPNSRVPSDHVPLAATLDLAPPALL